MNEWQPIATAPKDGSGILIVAGGLVFEAFWDYMHDVNVWRYANMTDDQSLSEIIEPTHWMPLPTPPVDIG